MVLKKAQHSRNTKVKLEESLGLYDLGSYSAISLSSIAQWKRRWLSGHAVQVRILSIVVCHLWKNLSYSKTYIFISNFCHPKFILS